MSSNVSFASQKILEKGSSSHQLDPMRFAWAGRHTVDAWAVVCAATTATLKPHGSTNASNVGHVQLDKTGPPDRAVPNSQVLLTLASTTFHLLHEMMLSLLCWLDWALLCYRNSSPGSLNSAI